MQQQAAIEYFHLHGSVGDEEMGLLRARNRRKRKIFIFQIEDVHVSLAILLRGDAPAARRYRSASRAVDRLAILGGPLADRVQAFDEFRLNLSGGHGSDIE